MPIAVLYYSIFYLSRCDGTCFVFLWRGDGGRVGGGRVVESDGTRGHGLLLEEMIRAGCRR